MQLFILHFPTCCTRQCALGVHAKINFLQCGDINNFISYICGCIILHNFCMDAYMDRAADATSLGKSHKTAEGR